MRPGHMFIAAAVAVVIGIAAAWSLYSDRAARSASDPPAPTTAASESRPASTPAGSAPAAAGATRPAPPLREALDIVPAETMLCWYGRPFPDVAPPDTPNAIQSLLPLVGQALSNEARLWARALEGFNIAIRYPHVLALIDAAATPETSTRPAMRADRIRFALIVETHGKDEPFARIIQAAINEQTDREKARLERRTAQRWSYMELSDQRLPEWCTIAWGNIEPFFIFAVGPDVWPEIAAVAAGQTEALSHTQWLETARDERARNALIEIIVRSQEIRERLDPFVDGRATAFFAAWHADDIERSHWAIGFEGRAMYCIANFIEDGQPRQRLLADPNIRNPELLATIPEGARYAIYHVKPAQTLPSFFNGLLATRSEAERRNIKRLWERIQKERGFDADRDILAHLGEYIVMHNDPPHPLHIPLAMTTLTEIRDEPQQVSRAIDALCEAWRDAQRKFQEATGEGPNNVLIDRDNDGVWYVKLGPVFDGPAWVVTDRFLITSWSSWALSSYLDKVGDKAGKRLAPQ